MKFSLGNVFVWNSKTTVRTEHGQLESFCEGHPMLDGTFPSIQLSRAIRYSDDFCPPVPVIRTGSC